jgi:hypothetical protein
LFAPTVFTLVKKEKDPDFVDLPFSRQPRQHQTRMVAKGSIRGELVLLDRGAPLVKNPCCQVAVPWMHSCKQCNSHPEVHAQFNPLACWQLSTPSPCCVVLTCSECTVIELHAVVMQNLLAMIARTDYDKEPYLQLAQEILLCVIPELLKGTHSHIHLQLFRCT